MKNFKLVIGGIFDILQVQTAIEVGYLLGKRCLVSLAFSTRSLRRQNKLSEVASDLKGNTLVEVAGKELVAFGDEIKTDCSPETDR